MFWCKGPPTPLGRRFRTQKVEAAKCGLVRYSDSGTPLGGVCRRPEVIAEMLKRDVPLDHCLQAWFSSTCSSPDQQLCAIR